MKKCLLALALGAIACARPASSLKTFPQLVAGSDVTCRLREGAAWCWSTGQPLRQLAPKGIRQVVLAGGATCVLDEVSHVQCLFDQTWQPVQVLEGASRIAGSERCVVGMHGGVGCTRLVCGLVEGRVRCQVESGHPQAMSAPRVWDWPALESVRDLTVVGTRICALQDRDVRCRQWPDDSAEVRQEPGLHKPRAFLPSTTPLCVREANRTVACWGYDTSEVLLGRGGWGARGTNHGVRRPPLVRTAQSIVSGRGFACVLDADGGVTCGGQNEQGQLGRPPDPIMHPMTPIAIDPAIEIAAGSTHVCVLHTEGTVRCWGSEERTERP
ncbi:MAG: RCC1 domain-containing protein [Myxococcota bacterium]